MENPVKVVKKEEIEINEWATLEEARKHVRENMAKEESKRNADLAMIEEARQAVKGDFVRNDEAQAEREKQLKPQQGDYGENRYGVEKRSEEN